MNVTHPLPPPLAKWWWTEWGPWSSCSKPSGGGERTRERFCDSNGVAFNIDRVLPEEWSQTQRRWSPVRAKSAGRAGKVNNLKSEQEQIVLEMSAKLKPYFKI